MTDLTARLSASTDPDRALDAEIALACGWRCVDAAHGDEWWEPDVHHWLQEPPEFTASIDAALTLVPAGWTWSGGRNGKNYQFVVQEMAIPRDKLLSFGKAATPALALCIAAMKARAQEDDDAG